jgi:hypothetical protein
MPQILWGLLRKQIMTTIEKATSAIIKAASRNKNITSHQLQTELENGFMDGWLSLPEVSNCNFSQWSAALADAIPTIKALEDLGI